MQYKATHKGTEELGVEQKADYILEGSLRRQGSQVRITAQLYNARRQGTLWANAYEQEASNILSLQRDVAARITSLVGTRTPSSGTESSSGIERQP